MTTLEKLLIHYCLLKNKNWYTSLLGHFNVGFNIFPFWLVLGLFALVPTEYNKVAVVPFLGQNQHVYM